MTDLQFAVLHSMAYEKNVPVDDKVAGALQSMSRDLLDLVKRPSADSIFMVAAEFIQRQCDDEGISEGTTINEHIYYNNWPSIIDIYEWQAMDENGEWFAYSEKPSITPGSSRWQETDGDTVGCARVPITPTVFPTHWKDTLQRRKI